MTTLFLILIAFVILTCIWLNNVSSRIGVPTLLAFLLLGLVFSNNAISPISFHNQVFAKEACTVALIFIMFYGGFGTRWESARPVIRESVLLASVGVILTAGLVGVFCHYVLHWGWIESFLLGSVISSTDAASVFSILRAKKLGLKNNTAPMLEVESGSNDPCAYMLTAIMLSLMNGSASAGHIAWIIVAQILFGLACGFGIAKLATMALDRIRFQGSGFDSLFIFAVAIASYAIPDLIGGNGYLSTYIVGIILGNHEFKNKKNLVHFFDGITGLMQVLIFFLLGFLATPSMLPKSILPALDIFLFLTLIARPASVVALLTPFRKYPFRQQMLISFVGLRGAASIVFAIVASAGIESLQHDFFNIVFCLVLISISVQGSLIPTVAKRLKMIDTKNDVMKTFNDYNENSEMQFGRIDISADSTWNGRAIRDIDIPKSALIVMIVRGKERILPRGHTVLMEGDQVITIMKHFEDNHTHLVEKTVKPSSRRVGHKLSEFAGNGLVVMIQRGEESIIPNGDTILYAGDRLILFDMTRTGENVRNG